MNEKRTAKKAYQLWEHHFYRWNYKKAISSFSKARDVSARYFFNEETIYLLSQSYYYLWDVNKSLTMIDVALEYSPWCLDALEFKLSLFDELWKTDESKELSQDINILKNWITNADLEAYCNIK